MNSGLKNWKTTLIGAAIAGLYALQSAGDMTAKKALITFAIAAFGFVCGDANQAANAGKAQG